MNEDAKSTPDSAGFGQVLDQFEAAQASHGDGARPAPSTGDKVKGRVASITPETVFVDLGGKAEAWIPVTELLDKDGILSVGVGDELEATVTGKDEATGSLILRRKLAGRGRGGSTSSISDDLRQAKAAGLPVEGVVTGFNKGGAEVRVGSLRCFCPTSQLDLKRVEDPAAFVGQRLSFKVERLEEGESGKRPNVVLSRRKLLEEESASRAAQTRAQLTVGAVLRGRVSSLTAYGAFVDLGGVEGLLHVSEISHARLAHPSEMLAVGQEIDVQVMKIDTSEPTAAAPAGEAGRGARPRAAKTERISLSRKALEGDPWREAAQRFPAGTEVMGRVRRLETFGAFVEVAPGLEGLLHISELGAMTGRRLNHAREAAEVDQDLKVRVQKVEPERRRISLAVVRDASTMRPALAAAAVPEELVEGKRPRGRRRPGDEEQRGARAAAPRRTAKGSGKGRARGLAEEAFGEDTAIGRVRRAARERDRDRARPAAREAEEAVPTPAGPPPTFGTLGDFFTRGTKRNR